MYPPPCIAGQFSSKTCAVKKNVTNNKVSNFEANENKIPYTVKF